MATEYKLSYTADEIDSRLGRVVSISNDVDVLQSDVGSLNDNVGAIQDNVGVLQSDIQKKVEVVKLTTAEFNALNEAGNIDDKTFYSLTDVDEEYNVEIELDSTLTKEGQAADAKAVGDAFANHEHSWNDLNDKPDSFAPSLHASTHSINGSDPITPVDIGAASASEQKWKHYSNLDHIGLTAGSETIDSIIINMPSFSVLEYVVGTSNATIYPTRYGLVRFVKADTSRFYGYFYPKDSTDVYHCSAIRENNALSFRDWVKEYNTGNKPTVADIAFLGNNPISSTTDDTVANWINLGTGYAWYSVAGQLTNQPAQWGFLISYVASGNDVFQIWRTQAGGPTYWRSGNGSGWAKTWAKIYDDQNKPTANDIMAGTFAGQVVANSSGQTYSTYLLRNTCLASADTNPTVNGQICWTYK